MKRTIDTKIWKTGNSFVLTIPKSIIDKFKLKKGEDLEADLNLKGRKND